MSDGHAATAALPRAEGPLTRAAFEQAAAAYRRELKLHCYRMMGSFTDAEDAVQEALLRAWRARDGLRDASAVRPWLYRIATNACLTLLKGRASGRRLFESGAPQPSGDPLAGPPAADVAWIEPYPDAELPDPAPGPQARVELKESVRLAFVAALHRLPARQRAALLLCDVVGWTPAEAAQLLGVSLASVNSALQRARAATTAEPVVASTPDPALLARYMAVWEARDLDGLVALLRPDVALYMPPWREWFQGRDAIGQLFGQVWPLYRGFRLLPAGANLQPTCAAYARGDGGWSAHSLHLLETDGSQIVSVTIYLQELGARHIRALGLPARLA